MAFPELDKEQRGKVAASKRVSNPGCYSHRRHRPDPAAGLGGHHAAELPISFNAVSGYTGGGKAMIAEFEDETAPNYTKVPYRIYALGLSTSTCRRSRRMAAC
jgi:N-acetyl-gamma-glutamyl-phosphate reductase